MRISAGLWEELHSHCYSTRAPLCTRVSKSICIRPQMSKADAHCPTLHHAGTASSPFACQWSVLTLAAILLPYHISHVRCVCCMIPKRASLSPALKGKGAILTDVALLDT